ncbi:hypothetical protein MauCBS54593_001376 [Microsporum audouinii]
MDSQHRNLPPPAAMGLTVTEMTSSNSSSSNSNGGASIPLPPPPTHPQPHLQGRDGRTWDSHDDAMRQWLQARVEEDKRKQEEERTRQEALKLDQRKIEHKMLQDTLSSNVPPHMVPLVFVGLAGPQAQWAQQYILQMTQNNGPAGMNPNLNPYQPQQPRHEQYTQQYRPPPPPSFPQQQPPPNPIYQPPEFSLRSKQNPMEPSENREIAPNPYAISAHRLSIPSSQQPQQPQSQQQARQQQQPHHPHHSPHPHHQQHQQQPSPPSSSHPHITIYGPNPMAHHAQMTTESLPRLSTASDMHHPIQQRNNSTPSSAAISAHTPSSYSHSQSYPSHPISTKQDSAAAPQMRQTSPSISFHHWVPPQSQPTTPAGKSPNSSPHSGNPASASSQTHHLRNEYQPSPKKRKAQSSHAPIPPPPSQLSEVATTDDLGSLPDRNPRNRSHSGASAEKRRQSSSATHSRSIGEYTFKINTRNNNTPHTYSSSSSKHQQHANQSQTQMQVSSLVRPSDPTQTPTTSRSHSRSRDVSPSSRGTRDTTRDRDPPIIHEPDTAAVATGPRASTNVCSSGDSTVYHTASNSLTSNETNGPVSNGDILRN